MKKSLSKEVTSVEIESLMLDRYFFTFFRRAIELTVLWCEGDKFAEELSLWLRGKECKGTIVLAYQFHPSPLFSLWSFVQFRSTYHESALPWWKSSSPHAQIPLWSSLSCNPQDATRIPCAEKSRYRSTHFDPYPRLKTTAPSQACPWTRSRARMDNCRGLRYSSC